MSNEAPAAKRKRTEQASSSKDHIDDNEDTTNGEEVSTNNSAEKQKEERYKEPFLMIELMDLRKTLTDMVVQSQLDLLQLFQDEQVRRSFLDRGRGQAATGGFGVGTGFGGLGRSNNDLNTLLQFYQQQLSQTLSYQQNVQQNWISQHNQLSSNWSGHSGLFGHSGFGGTSIVSGFQQKIQQALNQHQQLMSQDIFREIEDQIELKSKHEREALDQKIEQLIETNKTQNKQLRESLQRIKKEQVEQLKQLFEQQEKAIRNLVENK